MCGFGGIIKWNGSIAKEKLSAVASKVSFRGPDSTGLRIYDRKFEPQENAGEIGLFFNRLAILDLDKRSDQPFENDRYVLIFNGEIYNYKELRRELQSKNIVFHTSSDTEVLFHLLIAYGSKAINRLNGMFAFVFIDKKNGQLILARDRAGIKPLDFYLDASGFIFSSEADSIVRLMDKKPSICKEAVNLYLALQYIPTPLTIWEKIYKLPPGCYVEENINELPQKTKICPVAYWDAYDEVGSRLAQPKDLEECLVESLGSQLQSDVPLGLFLSSGIDSSLLASLINKYFGKDRLFDFFTVSFEGQQGYQADEYEEARTFLAGFNNEHFRHHVLKVDPLGIQDEVRSMYEYIDEPFGDYAVMLNHLISKRAKQYVTVVLSGDGSDELFWGYPRYNEWSKRQNGRLGRSVVHHLINRFPEGHLKRKLSRKFRTGTCETYIDMISSGYFLSGGSLMGSGCWWWEGLHELKSRKDLPALIDFKTYLADCMFYKVDRSSMGASLEVRVPYIDNNVIGLALQMDVAEKSTRSYPTKAPLKELLGKLAPHYRFDLPKRGFSLPLKEWIGSEWKELICSAMVATQLKDVGLYEDYASLRKRHYEYGKDQSVELWRLLNLAIFLETKSKISS